MKFCSKCKLEKLIDQFNKCKSSHDGLYAYCNICAKKYRNEHSVQRIKLLRVWREKHKDEVIAYSKQYREEHKKERTIINHKWQENHKEERIIYHKKYDKLKKQSDLNYKLKKCLRSRLWHALKINQKKGSAVKDLGCSIEFLKQYIESKFYSNMAWNNWGDIWQLDHITPLHTFDLTDRKQFKQAVHYTNLQPLTIEDHQKKTGIDNLRINTNETIF